MDCSVGGLFDKNRVLGCMMLQLDKDYKRIRPMQKHSDFYFTSYDWGSCTNPILFQSRKGPKEPVISRQPAPHNTHHRK